MHVQSCPSREELRRFALGLANEGNTVQVQSHLATCTDCLKAMDNLDEEDPLLSAMRAAPQVPAIPAQEIAALMDDLSRLRGHPGDTNPTCGVETLPPISEQLAFLQPPLEPGDLGQLGPYRVIKILGAGGMGLVFEAEDTALIRRVALKVMRPGAVANAVSRERFLREARAAAAIEHENIVTIYQVGEERGIAFLAQQLLKGESLDEKLKREGALTTPEVLRIGREIATGLQAAHERGLVHRDIKPANIWVEKAAGRAKLLDFGLARPLEDASLTRTGEVAGTPQYMAPEQAAGQTVDHRCDLFSLGCLLYRATTGRLPFAGRDVLAVLRALALETPPAPRTLSPNVPAGLSDLIMQLLAKEPQKRPATARLVAERLRMLEERGSESAPRPRAGRLFSVTAALLIVLLLIAGGMNGPAIYRFSTNQGVVVVETADPDIEVTVTRNGQRIAILDRTNGHRATIKSGRYEASLRGKSGWTLETDQFTLSRGGEEIVKVRLERATTEPRHSEQEGPNAALATGPSAPNNARRALARFELEDPFTVGRLVYSPNGAYAAVLNQGAKYAKDNPVPLTFSIRIWDLLHRKELYRLPSQPFSPIHFEFSADSSRFFSVDPMQLREWNVASGQLVRESQQYAMPSIAIDSRQRRYLYAGRSSLRLRNLDTDSLIHDFPDSGSDGWTALALSSDGRWALSGGGAKTSDSDTGIHDLRLWDLTTGKLAAQLAGHTRRVIGVAISPGGHQALSSDGDTVLHWDLSARKILAKFSIPRHRNLLAAPDFQQAVVISSQGPSLLDLPSQRVAKRLSRLVGPAAFAPDGKRLLFGDAEGVVQEVSLAAFEPVPEDVGKTATAGVNNPSVNAKRAAERVDNPPTQEAASHSLAPLPDIPPFRIDLEKNYSALMVSFSPDNRHALIVNGQDANKASENFTDYSVRIWNLQTQSEVARIPSDNRIGAAAFSADGKSVLWASSKPYQESGEFGEWSLDSLKEVQRMKMEIGFERGVIDPRQRCLLMSTRSGGAAQLRLADLKANRLGQEFDSQLPEALAALAISKDGRFALAGGGGKYGRTKSGSDYDLRLWEVRDGSTIGRLKGHTDQVRCAEFSSDGREAVTGGFDKRLIHWDLNSRDIKEQMHFEEEMIDLAVSPQFDRVVVASNSGKVRLIDLALHKEIGILPEAGVRRLAYSADGKYVITGGTNGVVQVLRLPEAGTAKEVEASVTSGQQPAHSPRRLADFHLGETRFVPSVYYAPDGLHAAIVNGLANETKEEPRCAIRIWNLEDGKETSRIPCHDFPRDIVFSKDGARMFYRVGIREICEWDVRAQQEVRRSSEFDIECAAFDLERRRYLSAAPGKIELLNLDTDRFIRKLPSPPAEAIRALALSADGARALSGGGGIKGGPQAAADYSLRLWNLADGTEICKLPGHVGEVRFVAFSADGAQAISSGMDEQLIQWDLIGQRIIEKYRVPRITKVAFNDDLTLAAALSFGSGIRILDLKNHRESTFVKRPAARGLDLSPDGRRLLVGDMGGRVEELDISSELPAG